jgi:hypothetical protein
MSKLRFRAYLGVSSSAAGAVLIFFGGLAILPGLAALGVGLAANVLIPRELNELRKVRSQAESSWRSIQDAWTKQPGNKQFIQIKTELNQLVQSLAELPNEERQQIQVLERKKREAQLKRHLDRFLITDATIKKLARGEKQFWGVLRYPSETLARASRPIRSRGGELSRSRFYGSVLRLLCQDVSPTY